MWAVGKKKKPAQSRAASQYWWVAGLVGGLPVTVVFY